MKIRWFTSPLIFSMWLISACMPAMAKEALPATLEKPMEQSSASMMEKPTAEMTKPMAEFTKAAMEIAPGDKQKSPEPMSKSSDMPMEMPSWFSVKLTDVSTGKPFMVSDFKGKVVLVEALAQWCPNCKKQQQQVLELHKTLGDNSDFVSIGLDIDPNANADQLKEYIKSNGFTWTYAVAPVEISNELASLYGTQFLNPPATPMLLINRDGKVSVLPLGSIKSSGELQQMIEPLLKAGM